MSLKSLLRPFSGGDADTIARLEARVAEAQDAVRSAEAEARSAALDVETSPDEVTAKRAEKADAAVLAAQVELRRCTDALTEARARKVAADDAETDAQRQKREADYRDALVALAEAGVGVDKAIDDLLAKVEAAVAAEQALLPLASNADKMALGNAHAALETILTQRLRAVTSGHAPWLPAEKLRWANYLPVAPR